VPLPNHPQNDPLSAFGAESAPARQDPERPVDEPVTPVDPVRDEIAALNAQVATLVAAVDDIKKLAQPPGRDPPHGSHPAASRSGEISRPHGRRGHCRGACHRAAVGIRSVSASGT
jgi:hypothetical protein